MNPKRVLVFGKGLLLDTGIAKLLSREADLEIVETLSGGATALLEQIEGLQPDVVVLDEVTYLADRTRLLSTLENYPDPRVVLVSADRNLVLIYEGHQVPIREPADLVDIVRRLPRRQ